MFQLFNIYHLIYIFITLVIFTLLDRFLIKMSNEKQFKFLYGLTIVNFIIHFLKVLVEFELSLSSKIYRIALTNLCAVNTFIYPFVLKFKNKILVNFLEFIGFFSGVVALVFCYDLNGTEPFILSNIRYWFTHFILMFVSFELIRTKQVKYDYRNVWYFYFLFFIEQIIIYLNDYILFVTNIIDRIDYSNGAFTYGIRESVLPYLGFVNYIIPSFLYQDGVYTPVLWMITPMILVLIVAFIISVTLIDRKHFVEDFKKIKEKIKQKRSVKDTK